MGLKIGKKPPMKHSNEKAKQKDATMNGLTNYITEQNWEDIITTWYVLIVDSYRGVIEKRGSPLRSRGPAPQLTDEEVITISVIIETFFQGHEEIGYAFVCQYLSNMFPNLVDIDRFNERRRQLVAVIEAIRRELRDQKIGQSERIRLVDSAPITLMTYTRGKRCQSVVGSQYFGVVTSKKSKFFGLRLHATVTPDQMIDEWLLAPASVHDLKVLDALVLDCRDLTLVGDKAYNDEELEYRLWKKRRIHLLPLRRDNQKEQWPDEVRRALGRVRHRIETVFSTLMTSFNVQRPRSRSLAGHLVRIATCVLAHTLCFLWPDFWPS
jgi:hypothetical protein